VSEQPGMNRCPEKKKPNSCSNQMLKLAWLPPSDYYRVRFNSTSLSSFSISLLWFKWLRLVLKGGRVVHDMAKPQRLGGRRMARTNERRLSAELSRI
jgi:hypothetical protein